EGYKEKAIRKTRENPWVPLGTLITAGALTMAAIRLRQGNSRKFQVWLRYRVAFQAFTIFAILGGLYKYGQANLEENQKIMEQINQQREQKHLAQERAELEQRIADAAKLHEEE
ncbi:hypoxia induced protein conserved region-domain-containing protein, partial [Lentinula aciculospora]